MRGITAEHFRRLTLGSDSSFETFLFCSTPSFTNTQGGWVLRAAQHVRSIGESEKQSTTDTTTRPLLHCTFPHSMQLQLSLACLFGVAVTYQATECTGRGSAADRRPDWNGYYNNMNCSVHRAVPSLLTRVFDKACQVRLYGSSFAETSH